MQIVVDEKLTIPLPGDVYGKLGFRAWRLQDGILQSIVMVYSWPTACAFAKIVSRTHGFYAHNLVEAPGMFLENYFKPQGSIYGFVELRGKVYEHEDGVLRGEHIRILNLFVLRNLQDGFYKQGLAEELSKYGVSLYLTSIARMRAILKAAKVSEENNECAFVGKEDIATSSSDLKGKVDDVLYRALRPPFKNNSCLVVTCEQITALKHACCLEQPYADVNIFSYKGYPVFVTYVREAMERAPFLV